MKMSLVRQKNFKIAILDILKDAVSIGKWNAIKEFRQHLGRISIELLKESSKKSPNDYKIKKLADELSDLVEIWS